MELAEELGSSHVMNLLCDRIVQSQPPVDSDAISHLCTDLLTHISGRKPVPWPRVSAWAAAAGLSASPCTLRHARPTFSSWRKKAITHLKFAPPSAVSHIGSHSRATASPEDCIEVAMEFPPHIFTDAMLINYQLYHVINYLLLHVAYLMREMETVKNMKFNSEEMRGSFLCYLTVDARLGKETRRVKIYCLPPRDRYTDSLVSKKLGPGCQSVTSKILTDGLPPLEGVQPSVEYNEEMRATVCLLQQRLQLTAAVEQLPAIVLSAARVLRLWARLKRAHHVLDEPTVSYLLWHFWHAGQLLPKTECGVFDVVCSLLKLLAAAAKLDHPHLPDRLLLQSRLSPVNVLYHVKDWQLRPLRALLHATLDAVGRLSQRVLFQRLLVDTQSIYSHFDELVTLTFPRSSLKGVVNDAHSLRDHNTDLSAFVSSVCSVIRRGLGDRITLCEPLNCHEPESFPLGQSESANADQSKSGGGGGGGGGGTADQSEERKLHELVVGLKVQFSQQYESVMRGPPLTEDEAEGIARFRALWGAEKCSLRRFKDGTVCYAVSWTAAAGGSDCAARQRTVNCQVVLHLLGLHLGLEDVQFTVNSFDRQLAAAAPGWLRGGTGEEEVAELRSEMQYVQLALAQLTDLPLPVHSVHCISDCARGTTVRPEPVEAVRNLPLLHREVVALSAAAVPPPPVVSPNHIVVTLAPSTRWPRDFAALQRFKAAFYFRMAALLPRQFELLCHATEEELLVVYRRHVFSVSIFSQQHELWMMRVGRNALGARTETDTPESLAYERRMVATPLLCSALDGFAHNFPQFPLIARLAKLWTRRHLLGLLLSDMVVELLVASMLQYHGRHAAAPGSAQAGLVAFWAFVARFDFHANFIFIQLGERQQQQQQPEDAPDHKRRPDVSKMFDYARHNFPPLTIFTNLSPESSEWTEAIDHTLLARLTRLCAAALHAVDRGGVLEASDSRITTVLFTPDMTGYDMLLHIAPSKMPQVRRRPPGRKRDASKALIVNRKVPPLDYFPGRLLAERLHQTLGHLLYVFFDTIDGSVIALKFKKCKRTAGAHSELLSRYLSSSCQHLVEEVKLMAGDIVSSVETLTDNWSFDT